MAADGTLQRHWPVPMAVHHFAQAAQINTVLADAFRAMRAADHKAPPSVLYASADDLLRRVELPEFAALVKFIVASVHATAQLGALNGATRFYSPMFMMLGGAYVDRGNAWMQQSTLDVMPKEGDLVLFPSFLPH